MFTFKPPGQPVKDSDPKNFKNDNFARECSPNWKEAKEKEKWQ
jgi:hypothetical protein